jgi:hypothetical protein
MMFPETLACAAVSTGGNAAVTPGTDMKEVSSIADISGEASDLHRIVRSAYIALFSMKDSASFAA